MELFSKIYSCYYQVVERILEEALLNPVTEKQITELIQKYGFAESVLTILPALTSQRWALLSLEKDGYHSRLKQKLRVPMTTLQKSWLKAVLLDKRIRLFLSSGEIEKIHMDLNAIPPLFYPDDFHYFDRCADSDPYEAPCYQTIFRQIQTAILKKELLEVVYSSTKKKPKTNRILPCFLEYSSQDDKFRFIGIRIAGGKPSDTVTMNLSRIISCQPASQNVPFTADAETLLSIPKSREPVVIRISGRRNSLERCMLHFARYEKWTEYEEAENSYLCSIYYDKQDEPALLIDILSFGPVIQVLSPNSFLKQIRKRVQKQMELLLK